LVQHGGISWNNYAGMQSEIGNFDNAINYFSKDMFTTYQRMLKEPFYYMPELFVYGGKTKEAISMAQQIIADRGSTPGFGWYNISLARACLYDGQLDSAEFALDKADNFKELHIGTTLTQTQYEFTINLLKVQLMDKKIALIKFLNKAWWYSPTDLYNIASLKAQKMMAEYVVVNELANNPERTRLVYDLFCAEATSSFDEAWYLLKDFSPSFFKKKYETYQRTDQRPNIQR
jgi:tetratricopeptide (TPR) repeat protein